MRLASLNLRLHVSLVYRIVFILQCPYRKDINVAMA